MYAIFVLGIHCFLGYLCGSIAREKKHDFTMWFIIGFFFGLLGLLVIGLMSPAGGAAPRRPRSRPRTATRPVSRPTSVTRATTTGRKTNPFRSR